MTDQKRTDQKSRVLEQLAAVYDRPAALRMRQWLAQETTHPLTEESHAVSVADIRNLWRVRVAIGSSKGHALEGAPELLEVLKTMNSRRKLQQVGFSDRKQMGNVFLTQRDGEFVGSVLF